MASGRSRLSQLAQRPPGDDPHPDAGTDVDTDDGTDTDTDDGADTDDGTAEIDATVEQLYRDHWVAMVRLALLLVDDRASAEDVVQDAFVAVHRNWSRVRDREGAVGYLRVAVVNTARSALRRRQTARRHLAGADVEHADAADVEVTLSEQSREILLAVRTLPPRQQEVLVLRFWSELSEKEIAATLGIAAGTVKSTAARALDALERRLTEGSR